MKTKCAAGWLFAILIVLGVNSPTNAVTINLTFDPSVAAEFGANTASMESATNYVAQEFESILSDAITININVAGAAGTSTLGSSNTLLAGPYSYGQIRSAMVSDAKTANDASAVASLPASDPSGGHSYFTSTAQARPWDCLGETPVLTVP